MELNPLTQLLRLFHPPVPGLAGLDDETLAEAVVNRPVRKVVVKAGRVVARDGVALV